MGKMPMPRSSCQIFFHPRRQAKVDQSGGGRARTWQGLDGSFAQEAGHQFGNGDCDEIEENLPHMPRFRGHTLHFL